MSLATPLPDLQDPIPPSTALRPGFSRSNSSPPARPVPTLQFLSTTSSSSSRPALKKRSSAFTVAPQSQADSTPPSIPQRPPRNPARGEVPGSTPLQRAGSSQGVAPRPPVPALPRYPRSRPSTATGGREEITPWEFYPAPQVEGGSHHSYESTHSTHIRSTLNTGLVEEVTPWELFPAPAEHGTQNPATQRSKGSSTRPSTATGTGKSLSEFALRRRKSTGAKLSKSRSSANPAPSPDKRPVSSSNNSTYSPDTPRPKSAPTTPKVTPVPVPTPGLLIPTPSSSAHSPKTPPKSPKPELKFSTADRTILEELKRNILARESQFVVKGAIPGGPTGVRQGRKHHAYSRTEVPYPRSYERVVLDLDVWETMFCQDICQSLTFHEFERPPIKVLDLGCGTGTWILNSARTWKECQFVGLDIVPLQPDLQRVGADFASRITWVQANFLDGIPFPDEEFDFVHTKRIALGVPEDKWDSLLEEITRVLKPGGAFEMVEEDLFFPGKPVDDDLDVEPGYGFDINQHDHTEGYAQDTDRTPISGSTLFESNGPTTPTNGSTSFLPLIGSRAGSPLPIREDAIAEDFEKEAEALTPTPIPHVEPHYITLIPPHSRSAARPPIRIKSASSNSHGPPNLHVPFKSLSQSKFASSTASLLSSLSVSSGPPTSDTSSEVKSEKRQSGSGTLTSTTQLPQFNPQISPTSGALPKKPVLKWTPLLLKTLPKKPTNPRDHSLLETIYLEMLASRFINHAPLSILANSLGLHFKDVRTHAPLQYNFPPPPAKKRRSQPSTPPESETDSDIDDARDAIIPATFRRRSRGDTQSTIQPQVEDQASPEDSRLSTMHGPVKHVSSYVSLDDTRPAVTSPMLKVTTPAEPPNATRAAAKVASRRKSRLPNATSNLDPKTLNLHLAIRTAEILACSESMWEWVREFQIAMEALKKDRERAMQATKRNRSGSLEAVQPYKSSSVLVNLSANIPEHVRNTILDLTREDFDNLFVRFEMDMRDHIAIRSELQNRFAWTVFPSSPTQDRKIFDAACEKWEQWEEDEQARSPSQNSYRPSGSRHRPSSSVSTQGPQPLSENRSTDGHHHESPDQYRMLRRTYSNLEDESYASSTPNGSTQPSTLNVLPNRQSRVIRVFVAWKAK
ncbi:hypothetical protein BDN72DRAFT_634881 [Pluteus cervinus]|uniref:Uncharacterized protein n=1 Tax=Pluteus cervinus TaxID=181527 RepID=A0ACD3BAI3_9AGAR|nr:hypothetical protein BDN72DRAFT_634881 [Pluteus cervinus]